MVLDIRGGLALVGVKLMQGVLCLGPLQLTRYHSEQISQVLRKAKIDCQADELVGQQQAVDWQQQALD